MDQGAPAIRSIGMNACGKHGGDVLMDTTLSRIAYWNCMRWLGN